MGEFLWITSI